MWRERSERHEEVGEGEAISTVGASSLLGRTEFVIRACWCNRLGYWCGEAVHECRRNMTAATTSPTDSTAAFGGPSRPSRDADSRASPRSSARAIPAVSKNDASDSHLLRQPATVDFHVLAGDVVRVLVEEELGRLHEVGVGGGASAREVLRELVGVLHHIG